MRDRLRPTSHHRASLAGVALSVAAAAGALATAFGDAAGAVWPAIILAWATALLLASLIGLATARPERGRPTSAAPIWVAVLSVLILVGGGLSIALAIGAAEPGAALLGGLPLGAAVLVYAVGILPALIIPALYAWGFERNTLAREDLERLRAHLRDAEDGR